MNDPPITKAQTKLLADLAGAAGRRREGSCLVEGAILLDEALAAGLVPRLIAVAPEAAAVEAARACIESARGAGAVVVELSERAASRLSDREHAPGLLAAVPLPPAWEGPPGRSGPTLLVAVCGVQDPGNVGTLLRSAVAFGAEAVLVAPGSADPFGPKVVRASAGAALRLPCATTTVEALADMAAASDLELCAAVPPGHGEAAAGDGLACSALPARCMLALGHETRGLPSLAAARNVSVPQTAAAESLNVAMAGSILMAGWYSANAASRPAS